jgi:hypothetical protein
MWGSEFIKVLREEKVFSSGFCHNPLLNV